MPKRRPVFGSPAVRRELRRLRKPLQSEGLHLGGTCGLEIAERELAKGRKSAPTPKLQLVRKGAGRG